MASKALVWGTSSNPSHIREWANKIMGSATGMSRAKHHLSAGGEALRAGGEAGIVGGALGAMHAMLPTGLDLDMGGPMPVPLDGAVAAAGLIGSAIAGPGDGFGTDLRNAGTVGLGILTFRKTAAFVAEKRALKGLPTGAVSAGYHGEFGEDPILKVARKVAR
jgi:hypothetical protein